tara:strand:- start:4778 stop:5455 length:678 start_codon:yes stop_codon:yes gene_type:complete
MDDPKKIIIALDYDHIDYALALSDKVNPELCRLKIGKELFTKYGPHIVRDIQNKGFDIFLDLKFHDIPTTVYKACLSALSLNIWMLNVHLSGGVDMVKAAMKAKKHSETSTKLIGVSVLTSLSDNDCLKIYGCSRHEELQRLKHIAAESEVDGFVCSPYDINTLKDPSKIYVTPGIRISNDKQDHHKAAKPREAIDLGADYLVIGRSVTNSESPNTILEEIIETL